MPASDKKLIAQFRYLLKDSVRQEISFAHTDQHMGLPPPPIEKPCPGDAVRIPLAPAQQLQSVATIDLFTAIARRRSRRAYTAEPLSINELSFLVWATQGIKKVAGQGTAFRTVPSAGCRHAFETYLCIFNVTGIEQGIYRYLPLSHEISLVSQPADLPARVARAALGQEFAGRSAVTFVWTAIPYRTEWRYDIAAHKVIAVDAGHVCQNLYLACEAISAGTCAIGAYHQEGMDALLGVDGEEEFTIYIAPVGKVRQGRE